MTTFSLRQLIGDLLKDYFQQHQYPPSSERAQNWRPSRQVTPTQKPELRISPMRERAIANGTSYDPRLLKKTHLKPQERRDIFSSLGTLPISHNEHNQPSPQQPLLELPAPPPIEKENTSCPVEKSLILWPDQDGPDDQAEQGEDCDLTEKMAVVKARPQRNSNTTELPALEVLSWFVRSEPHAQGTGEQERLEQPVQEKMWML